MTPKVGLRKLPFIALVALAVSACTGPRDAAGPAAAGASQLAENPLLGAWRLSPAQAQQGWVDRVGLDRLRFTDEVMVKRDQAVPVRYTVQGDFVLVRAVMGEFYVYQVLAADLVCLQGIGLGSSSQGTDADPGPSPERVCYQRV